MPALILFILIVVLIAHIGFWDTLGAILGAVAMTVLLIGIIAAIVTLGIYLLFRRTRPGA
jgi:hypothetical protein